MSRSPLVLRFTFAVSFLASITLYAEEPRWYTDTASAVARADADGRLVLVHVRASCRTCDP
jgi:hypothetical protein